MFQKIRNDFFPSLVVFLIALPLCMGIAIASGMPPQSGLITGIVGGILVGSFSGCPLQVSGPAAGLAVIVWQLVEKFGPVGLAWIVFLAGLTQIAMGFLRLGQVFRAISPSIIQGMLSGIGTLIVLSQWYVMHDSRPYSSGISNLMGLGGSIQKLLSQDPSVSTTAFGLGTASIAVIVLWKKWAPKKLQLLPGSLIAAILATTVASLLAWDIKKIDIPLNFMESIQVLSFSSYSALPWAEILLAVATISFVATAETLLSAAAVDQMHHGPRANYDKELVSQGIGNTLCGLLGALPMTGVIVRSGANVQAGAVSRASAIMHGTWLLIFVLFFPWILNLIPVSALAAILVFTGFKLLDYSAIKKLWSKSRTEVLIFLATYLTVVLIDLLKGVLVGLALAIAKLVYTLSHLEVKLKTTQEGKRTDLYLKGAATFVRLPQLASTLDKVSSNSELHVFMDDLTLLDHACLELLEKTSQRFEANQGKVVVEWDNVYSKFKSQFQLRRTYEKIS